MGIRKKKLPIGIEHFESMIKDGYYYVDKTRLIADLLNSGGYVTLFTRPRRFGKSLNMSMLESFFSPDSDKAVFDGLKISDETQLCAQFMGKFPVIFISLKDIDAADYDMAFQLAVQVINETAYRVYPQMKESERLLPEEKELLSRFIRTDLTEAELTASLRILSRLMEKHYEQKVIILIDEYDVPLAKAYENGYYDRMLRLIRNLFHQGLKTNSSLKLSALTGCMRISKESVFTGLNNLIVRSISEVEYDEYFGFTDREVRQMLEYYECSDLYDTVKEWYDGYRFGQTDVYCPWDVISYCDRLRTQKDALPENFWMNSSENYAVKRFIACSSNPALKGEIESLINGEAVEKTIRQDLTYDEMYASMDNIWSVLYTTGYLTQDGRSGSRIRLIIPNREVCSIFSEQILELFREDVKKDDASLQAFCCALAEGDVSRAQECMGEYLRRTISIRDTAVRNSLKENFYHGILLGILSGKTDWVVLSNQESGNGYSDIQIRDDEASLAMVIEVKYADDGNLQATCERGLRQIEEKRYADSLPEGEYRTILKYGMAFYRKECRILLNRQLIEFQKMTDE